MRHQCPKCERRFNTEAARNGHLSVHEPKVQRPMTERRTKVLVKDGKEYRYLDWWRSINPPECA